MNDLQVAAGLMRSFQQQQQEEQLKRKTDEQESKVNESASRIKESVSSATVETVMIGDVEFSVQALSTAHWPTYPGK